MRSLALFVAFSLGGAVAARAQGTSCAGPGAAYGVTSYECERCALRMKDGRVEYVFHVEPRVLEVEPGSLLQVGDVIVGFGKNPITTPEGSKAFTYPSRGVHFIDLRRGGRPTVLTAKVTVDCGPHAPPPPAAGDPSLTAAILERMVGNVRTGTLGFALGCLPSCTRTRSADGKDYWKFDGEPPVVAVRPGTPAAAAGLRVGDIVVDVDGVPVVTSEGAFRLFTAQSPTRALTFTVVRDKERRTITITPK